MRYVPTNAAFLTIGGGIMVTFGGLVESFNGTHWPGIGNGLLIVLLGVLMILLPENMTAWGVLGIGLGVVSLLTASFGGFLIGFILTLLGGIYARRFKVPDVGGAPAGTMTPAGGYGAPQPWTTSTLPSGSIPGPTPGSTQTFVAAPPLAALYCPWCGRPARYIPEYSRYYCDTDRRYI